MTTIISREDWGARNPGKTFVRMGQIYGVTIHWNGPGMGPYTHNHCDDRLRSMQRYHIEGNGWNDIGYNFIVCRHGYVYEGRGLFAVGAHAGASHIGGNTHWYGVQAMLGVGDEIPDAMLRAINWAITYLRDKGNAGKKVNGHRDHHSTDCPGGPLYAWIQKGRPLAGPAPTPTPPVTQEEEDVQDYTSAAHSGTSPVKVEPNKWTDVWFDTVYQDPTGAFGQGKKPQPTILIGKKDYTLECGVQLAADNDAGDLEGTLIQLRTVEYKYVTATGSEPAHDQLVEEGVAHAGISEGAVIEHAAAFVGRANADQKLRVQVRHDADIPLMITFAKVAARSENV